MDLDGIVPDVIDVAPKAVATVTYPSGVKVDFGNELTPTQVKDQPDVTWDAEDDGLYILAMIDPDAPSRENPIYRAFLHWVVINIPGNQLAKGQTTVEYVGSGPPKDGGLHRNAFLVFKQKEKITTNFFLTKTTRAGRENVKTSELLIKYRSKDPVAGNYFKVQYDDYVPIIYKQLK